VDCRLKHTYLRIAYVICKRAYVIGLGVYLLQMQTYCCASQRKDIETGFASNVVECLPQCVKCFILHVALYDEKWLNVFKFGRSFIWRRDYTTPTRIKIKFTSHLWYRPRSRWNISHVLHFMLFLINNICDTFIWTLYYLYIGLEWSSSVFRVLKISVHKLQTSEFSLKVVLSSFSLMASIFRPSLSYNTSAFFSFMHIII
jgi:hypothetical protein